MEADYIVVGAGSAGCAMAFRLTEAGHRVVVIEHGGSDAGPFINMPGALSYPMGMKLYDWGYRSEPEPQLGGRRMAVPRGKVIGGSSSINGMVYVRGHPRDFDHWAEQGATGWSFADVLPYFKRMERWHAGSNGGGNGGSHDAGIGGDPGWRGTDGPLHISRGLRDNPLHDAFVTAGLQAGYEATADYNGKQQEGFGPMDRTIWQGRRWSAASAYLRPALRHDNCTLIRGLVRRVLIEDGRATGVEISRGRRRETVRARAEVILCAGAINSPKLLLLSGVGPGDEIRAAGVAPLVDRPGVGRNLQDHLEVYVQYSSLEPITLYRYWNLMGKALVGARWLLAGTGPGASNQFESAAFIRSAPGVDYPDIQYHFLPLAVRYDGRVAAQGHGFQAHVGPMRSESRGWVRLDGPDPRTAPRIFFNYMSAPDDWEQFRRAVRLTQEIFRQEAFLPYVREEIQPGAQADSDAALDAFIRAEAESAYHPCGTCRMGRADDPDAVIDPECRVIGVDGLRVADSSIFPRITNGNLNAPSIMVGERAADLVLGRPSLPPETLEPWVHPNWAVAQR